MAISEWKKQYVHTIEKDGYFVDIVVRYDLYFKHSIFTFFKKSPFENDLKALEELSKNPTHPGWESRDENWEYKEEDAEEGAPKAVVLAYGKNPVPITEEEYIKITFAFLSKAWDEVISKEGAVLFETLKTKGNFQYDYIKESKGLKNERPHEKNRLRVIMSVFDSQMKGGAGDKQAIALNYTTVNDQHLVYFGISGRTLMSQVVLPTLYKTQIDWAYFTETWKHEIEHHGQTHQGVFNEHFDNAKERQKQLEAGLLTHGKKNLQEKIDILYTEGVATYVERSGKNFDYDGQQLQNLVNLLRAIGRKRTKQSADDAADEFLSDVYDGEYVLGQAIAVIIALSVQVEQMGENARIDIIRNGTRFDVPAKQIPALIASGKVVFAPLQGTYAEQALEVLRSLRNTTTMIRRYELACQFLGIKNPIITSAEIEKLRTIIKTR